MQGLSANCTFDSSLSSALWAEGFCAWELVCTFLLVQVNKNAKADTKQLKRRSEGTSDASQMKAECT